MIRIAAFFAFVLPAAAVAQSSQCTDVLIADSSTIEKNTRYALDIISYQKAIEKSGNTRSSGASFGVPINGIPVEVGLNSDAARQAYSYLEEYNQHKADFAESQFVTLSVVGSVKVKAWADCMRTRKEFYAFVHGNSVTDTTATIVVGNWPTGAFRPSRLKASGPAVTFSENGKSSISKTIGIVGETLLEISADRSKPTVINLELDGKVEVLAIPKLRQKLRVPQITYHVHGMFQGAYVDQTFKTPNFDAGPGFPFNPALGLNFQIDQLVDGEVCASKSINQGTLGDQMDAEPTWQSAGIRAGCNLLGTPFPSSAQCFVDPVYPWSC